MTNMTLHQYLQQVKGALFQGTGDQLASCFSFRNDHVRNFRLQIEEPDQRTQRWFRPPYDEMVNCHLKATFYISRQRLAECFYSHLQCLQAFNRDFQAQKESNWALPLMVELILDARFLALWAAKQMYSRDESKTDEILEKAADGIMTCFRICASDTRTEIENSKRWGMLHIVNQLFKIYFKMGNMKLCKPLIRAIESSNIKDEYTKAQLVTYRYFLGRLQMFENDYRSAADSLSYAFQNCFPGARRNLRLILIYLIPVKMILGILPSHLLIRNFQLWEFQDISVAIRTGNIRLMNSALAQFNDFFMRAGILLILERLKVMVYRNLFRRVAFVLQTHQIDIKAFMTVLHLQGETDLDIDDVEFIVADLIYKGYVKGYISHAHGKVVVSKQNAFPSISSLV